MLKATIHNEGVSVISIYAPNNRRYRGNRRLLTVGDFTKPFSSKTDQIDNKDVGDQNV